MSPFFVWSPIRSVLWIPGAELPLYFLALAADYDGTIADHGFVNSAKYSGAMLRLVKGDRSSTRLHSRNSTRRAWIRGRDRLDLYQRARRRADK